MTYGLYIHVPFCHSKCWYCDFCSRPPASEEMIEGYIEQAKNEMRARMPSEPPATVYIGGGTPSLLSDTQLRHLIEGIDLSRCKEFTIEVNPEDITDEFAQNIADSPINRVSMGVQTLDDEQLKAIGRRHTSAQAIDAYNTLRRHGVANISLDLIYGLPDQSEESWVSSLRRLLALRPEHLSCYLLSYEPGTRLTARRDRGRVVEASAEVAEEMYLKLCGIAAEEGYIHYEISNFCLPGYHSRHNSSYWDSTPYIGIGPGAHSLSPTMERSFNQADIQLYIREGYRATLTQDPEDDVQRLNDYIITRLRTSAGVHLPDMELRFGIDRAKRLLADASRHLVAGRLNLAADTLTIPERHWLISDSILVDLIAERETEP